MIRCRRAGDRHVEVTFVLPVDHPGEPAGVAGDFNDWRWQLTPFIDCGATWEATAIVDGGRQYQFRYRSRDDSWFNDDRADDYVPNSHGGVDCVVDVDRCEN